MRIHLIAAAAVSLVGSAWAGDGIMPVRENGRVIFVNDERSSTQASTSSNGGDCSTSGVRGSYVYWSVTHKRWKRVPAPSAAQVRSACSAAKEVEATLAMPAKSAASAAPEVTAKRTQWTSASVDALIDEVAKRHSVDPNLVRAMIKVESNFNPRAVSRKGAIGLMQLMPSTARELRVSNPYDPAQNLDGGVRHIKNLLEKNNGDVALSLAAYNAGQGAVERHGGVPNYKETRSYVQRITNLYADTGSVGGAIVNRSTIRQTKDADGHRLFTND